MLWKLQGQIRDLPFIFPFPQIELLHLGYDSFFPE